MNHAAQIAKHFNDAFNGGNWTWVNLKETLKDITWQQATTPVYNCNTIAVLTYHISYYVTVQLKVLKDGSLEGTDKDSFNCPPVQSQEDWETLLRKIWQEVEEYTLLSQQLPDDRLDEVFILEKYGNWYRNLLGIIEHTHYHMGQIVILKKILQQDGK
jgi:hypothetical protein